MKILIVFLLLLLSGLASAERTEVTTIPVMGQPAAALVEAVRPLLGRDGSVSAWRDMLIVRGTREQLAAVRSLVSEIDRPPRRLIIEVRQGGQLSLSTRGIGYGVDTGNVRLGRANPDGGGRITYQGAQTRARDDSLQRVQALDGRPALIRTGQSVPVQRAYRGIVGRRMVQGFEMHYRDTASGFVALPHVHGDQVTVEIFQSHERPAGNGGFDLQRAATVLRGELGQWLTLGSIGSEDDDQDHQVGRHLQTHRAQDRQLELRVIPVN
jgi:hypothetical protein